MTNNNNWIEKLWDKHCKPNGYCVKNPSLFEKDVENHISNLLTKKDQKISEIYDKAHAVGFRDCALKLQQEHKAELEIIKGEIIENIHKYIQECRNKGFETQTIVEHLENKYIVANIINPPQQGE